MNINDCTVYVFTRNDLPLGQDDIQTDHACFHLGLVVAQRMATPPAGIPWLIVKEKMRSSSIEKLAKVCVDGDIAHYLMFDDDVDKERPTALAAMAVNEQEKEIFRRYPLRKYAPAEQSAALDGKGAPVSTDVAQGSLKGQLEHPVSNGEVAGADPAVSSKHMNCS